MTDIEEIINSVSRDHEELTEDVENLRERLREVAIGGKSKEYLGKSITSEEISKLDREEVNKLYGRYEACIGSLVTKTMKKHIISGYTNLLKLFLPTSLAIVDRDALEHSLNEGPFIELALNKWTSSMYHRFGHYLGPVEALLLTSNHVQKINDDRVVPERPEEETTVKREEAEGDKE